MIVLCCYFKTLTDWHHLYAYKMQTSLSEKVVVNWHGCHTAQKFGLKANENHNMRPTLY